MDTDQSVYIAKPAFPWLTLFIILLAPLITVIDVFIVNVSLPTIQGFFHASDAGVQGIIASYLVGYAVFLITGSRAGDYFGRRKVFIMGLFFFTLTSALCGYSASIGQLIGFRFLQGISAGFAVPQTVTLIQLNFPGAEDRSKAFGYYGITLGVASILGQFLGGYFITSQWMTESWRLIFLINVPVGLLAMILAWGFITESRSSGIARFDTGGVLLLTAALSALIYPVIQGRELGWPLWTVGLLFLSFVLFVVFVRQQEHRTRIGKDPLVNLSLFRIKRFNIGLLMVVCYFGLYSAFLMTCALFLQNGHHIDALKSASYFVILGAAFMFSSHWSIKNGARYGTKLLIGASFLLLASFTGQLFLLHDPLSRLMITGLFIAYGLGAGLLVPSLLKISLQQVPAELAGVASGVYTTIQQFSSALGISVIGGVFFYASHKGAGSYDAGYKAALCCMILYTAAITILLYILKRMDNRA